MKNEQINSNTNSEIIAELNGFLIESAKHKEGEQSVCLKGVKDGERYSVTFAAVSENYSLADSFLFVGCDKVLKHAPKQSNRFIELHVKGTGTAVAVAIDSITLFHNGCVDVVGGAIRVEEKYDKIHELIISAETEREQG